MTKKSYRKIGTMNSTSKRRVVLEQKSSSKLAILITLIGIAFLLFGLVSLALAASEPQTENLLKFNRGLNSQSSPFSLSTDELTEANNVNYVIDGSVARRNGNVAVGGAVAAARITALYDFIQSDGAQDLVAVAGTVQAKQDSVDGTWDTITGGPALTTNILRDCVVFENELLCTDDTSTDGTWQLTAGGATATDWNTNFAVGSIEKARFVTVFQNYVVLARVEDNGGTDYNSRFYWSTLGDADTWSATDFIDVDTETETGGIGGMEVLGQYLYIFKERGGVYRVRFTGDNSIPFTVEKTACENGTNAGFTIKNFNNVLFYYSQIRPGIYAFDGNECIEISSKIEPTIEGYDESISTEFVAGIHHPRNQYWLGMRSAGSSENDRIVVYDIDNNAFSIFTGIEAAFMASVRYSNVTQMFTGDYSGYALQQDTGNTDTLDGTAGTTIDSSIRTAWLPLGQPVMTKSIMHTMVYHSLAGNYNLNFAYAYDFESADQFMTAFPVYAGGAVWDTDVWDAFTWASKGGGALTRVDMRGSGAFIRYHIYNNENVASWELYGITPIFRYEKIHRPTSLIE